MNFGAHFPNLSVPPPPLTVQPAGAPARAHANLNLNHGNGRGMGSRPNFNKFTQFQRPPPPHNQQYLPFTRPNMTQPPPQAQGHVNNCINFTGNSRSTSSGGFKPYQGNNQNQQSVRGPFPPFARSNPPLHNHSSREPIKFGSDEMFGIAVNNNVNSHSFPFRNNNINNRHQNCESNNPHNPSVVCQRGRGFHSNRGGSSRGSRGHGNFNHNQSDRKFNNIPYNERNRDQGPPKKKKERIDKRELPENNVFCCDTCDRGFKTEEKYKEHIDGHQKCSFKDCPFVAAPKLVQLHMTMQHRGGLAKKIYSLESEEDVRKWKEDRKRNYPTAANIQKKKDLRAERAKRGEVLDTKDFSKMQRGRNRNQGRGRGRGRHNRGRWRNRGHCDEEEHEVSDDDDAPPMEMKIERNSCQVEEDVGAKDQQNQGEQIDAVNNTAKEATMTDNETHKEEEIATSLSLLVGYGSCSSTEDSSDDEGDSLNNSNPAQDLATQVSLSQSNNTGNSTPLKIKSELDVLFQPFSHDSDSPSSMSTGQRQVSPVATSPSSGHSPGNSPTSSYDTDPFNLRNGDLAQSERFKENDNRAKFCKPFAAAVLMNSNLDSFTKNPKDGPTEGPGDSASSNDFSIDDSEVFTEMEGLSDGKFPACEVKLDNSCSGQEDFPKLQDRQRGTKRSHASSYPNSNRGNEDYARGGAGNKRRRGNQRPRPKSYTLLEKLLAKQIRQERNKILQCVHFIVKNKFFDEDGTASSMS